MVRIEKSVKYLLMKKELSYTSMSDSNLPKSYDFGAHEISPKTKDFSYFQNGRIVNPSVPNEDLSNLEDIVNEFINLYKL